MPHLDFHALFLPASFVRMSKTHASTSSNTESLPPWGMQNNSQWEEENTSRSPTGNTASRISVHTLYSDWIKAVGRHLQVYYQEQPV